jgi:hypothetical protein
MLYSFFCKKNKTKNFKFKLGQLGLLKALASPLSPSIPPFKGQFVLGR